MAGPVGVDVLAWLSEELIGVGTEVVTLGLDEIGRNTGGPVGRRERGKSKARKEVDNKSCLYTCTSVSLNLFFTLQLLPVAIKEGQSSAESRSGDAKCYSLSNDLPPRLLALEDLLLEEVIKEKVLKARVLVKCLLDVAKEDTKGKGRGTGREGERERERG